MIDRGHSMVQFRDAGRAHQYRTDFARHGGKAQGQFNQLLRLAGLDQRDQAPRRLHIRRLTGAGGNRFHFRHTKGAAIF